MRMHSEAFRSLFIVRVMMAYCTGRERIILSNTLAQKWCANVCNFCVSISQRQFHTFIECAKYNSLEDPAAASVVVPVTAILKKVLLYPRINNPTKTCCH